MKNRLGTILTVSVFLLGLSVFLYPKISNGIHSYRQKKMISRYLREVDSSGNDSNNAALAAAREYNRLLPDNPYRLVYFSEKEEEEYNRMLNDGSDKVIGILDIPSIHVNLPIYHGTSKSVLQAGIGHLQGTSLPVGGPGTHAVITGHRGLPSATLLTDLGKMKVGDRFAIYILDEILTYQVDQIRTVEPDNAAPYEIDPEMDYCTLGTCTPYGINTKRLLVRGCRADDAPEWAPRTAHKGTVLLCVLLLALLLYPAVRFMITHRKRRLLR